MGRQLDIAGEIDIAVVGEDICPGNGDGTGRGALIGPEVGAADMDVDVVIDRDVADVGVNDQAGKAVGVGARVIDATRGCVKGDVAVDRDVPISKDAGLRVGVGGRARVARQRRNQDIAGDSDVAVRGVQEKAGQRACIVAVGVVLDGSRRDVDRTRDVDALAGLDIGQRVAPGAGIEGARTVIAAERMDDDIAAADNIAVHRIELEIGHRGGVLV
ncbi:MAG: hypothetical protein ACRECA_08915, partial [Pseudolabrys sp.]